MQVLLGGAPSYGTYETNKMCRNPEKAVKRGADCRNFESLVRYLRIHHRTKLETKLRSIDMVVTARLKPAMTFNRRQAHVGAFLKFT